jgi:dipeptidyl aminopeptidase/acylaminoacyl peptidase
LKLTKLNENKIYFVVSGQTNSLGDLKRPEGGKNRNSTERIYTSLPIRNMETWTDQTPTSLFYGSLIKMGGNWSLVPGGLRNLLQDQKGFDPTEYEISSTGAAFVSKSPEIQHWKTPASKVYFVSLDALTDAKIPPPQEVMTENLYGKSSSPVFSPDGRQLAFLKMKQEQYEADKNRIILVPDISKPHETVEILSAEDGFPSGWNASPGSLLWSNDGKALLALAEEKGSVKVFRILLSDKHRKLTLLPTTGCVSSIQRLGPGDERLVLTSSSFGVPNTYSIIDPLALESFKKPEYLHTISSHTIPTLSRPQVREITYRSHDAEIHSFLVTPPNFDAGEKYPVLFLIHGGPQYSWRDDFPLLGMFNPYIFAAQGYCVFLPNITGSSGYGQAFTDEITGNWGGRPYQDLEAGFEYLSQWNDFNFLDMNRAVAAGQSFGGYLIYWLAGQSLGKKFKALVSDSGVFDTSAFASSTDEPWFPAHQFQGRWWKEDERDGIEKWNPRRGVESWETPMMILANGNDFKVPEAQGVAAFSALMEMGVEGKYLGCEGEGHLVMGEENVRVVLREVLGFLGRYTGVEGRDLE